MQSDTFQIPDYNQDLDPLAHNVEQIGQVYVESSPETMPTPETIVKQMGANVIRLRETYFADDQSSGAVRGYENRLFDVGSDKRAA